MRKINKGNKDNLFSSALSVRDWNLLKLRLENPQYNEKLAKFMNAAEKADIEVIEVE